MISFLPGVAFVTLDSGISNATLLSTLKFNELAGGKKKESVKLPIGHK